VQSPLRILAAVDFSHPARRAFAYALALSRQRGAALTVVHAVPANEPSRRHARARVGLIAQLRREAETAAVPFEVSVQQGDPAEVILLHARSRHPDLLVIGTHRRTGLERLKTASIAERVALRATQPLLIVPVLDNPSGGDFTHIAVASGLTGGSTRAIEQALTLVDAGPSHLTLVHVVPGATKGEQGSGEGGALRLLYPYGAIEYQNGLVNDAWQRLQEAVPRTAHPTARIHGRVVTGDPATEIERVASEVGADLIVAGASRRGVLAQKVFGTTVGRIVRIAERPVLVVPTSTKRAQLSRDFAQHRRAA
jgi:universal stress protein E